LTQGWSVTRDVSWVSAGQFLIQRGEQVGGLAAPATSSAEWIVEAPASCHGSVCHQSSLARFSDVAMHGIAAVGNGSTGTLADSAWNVIRLRLVPGKVQIPSYPTRTPFSHNAAENGTASSPAGATPGATSSSGRAFDVRWVPVAKGVV
jgi:hypothetical protein